MNKKDIKHEEPIVPDPIYSLVLGGWKAHILKTALQLDVFSDVHKGLRTVQEIVASKKWQLRAIRMLLDSLCPLGFLAKKDEEYFLTPISEAFLVRDSDTYAGGYVLAALASDTWEQLAEAVRTGKRKIPDLKSQEFASVWEQDASIESMRTSRIGESLSMWRIAGIDPNAKQKLKILDLASGCGIKSFVLAKQNPNAEITCIDWAGVLQVAERLAKKWGISRQVNMRPGDLGEMEYGNSEFDAVLLGQITPYWSPEQNESVLRKVHSALIPGGITLIHTPTADEGRCRSDSLITAVVTFLFSESGDIYTFSEYKGMMEEVGFCRITQHSESLISARK